MRHCTLSVILLGVAVTAAGAQGADWIFAPSYYTHDPTTGRRVTQYSPIGPFYVYPRADYLESGYRHVRSSLRAGGSFDDIHIVQEWGRPVRPYGEWKRPYRPYSVPYGLWGPPFGYGAPGWGGPWGAGPYGYGGAYGYGGGAAGYGGGPGYPGHGAGGGGHPGYGAGGGAAGHGGGAGHLPD